MSGEGRPGTSTAVLRGNKAQELHECLHVSAYDVIVTATTSQSYVPTAILVTDLISGMIGCSIFLTTDLYRNL